MDLQQQLDELKSLLNEVLSNVKKPALITQVEEEALIQKFLEQDKLNLVAQNANSDSSGVSS